MSPSFTPSISARIVLVSLCLVQQLSLPLQAAKLLQVQPVDESILMITFRDGEVAYRDDGQGPSAYDGHAWAPGDDQLVPFGDPLDVEAATDPRNWQIISRNNTITTYAGPDGARPTRVNRKSKVNQATHDWDYHLDHWLYLHLPEPLTPGETYILQIAPETGSLVSEFAFTYQLESSISEAIHVNLLGYTPDSPVKAADLYLWLGDGGPRDFSGFEGNVVSLYDIHLGAAFPAGEVRFWKDNIPEAEGRSLTGSPVWTADFSGFNRPGSYRLVIDGVGASPVFEIREDLWHAPYQTSLRGYYYMRVGEPITDLRPIPRQPRFIQGVDPVDFHIYITDLDPFDPEWEDHPGDTWDEPHFKPAEESMFWKRRLPGNPTNPRAIGGHSDALDWDRHIAHVVNLYDILLPYIITDGIPAEDDLGIAESGNGIPDLIDEARNEVDLFLSLRDGAAYSQGLTNPSRERTAMFQAGTTTMAAWANAANAAMLAEAFRVAGQEDRMRFYLDEAIQAFHFAEAQENQQLDDLQGIGDGRMRGRDFRMMAAAYLFNLTGLPVWEDRMAEDSVSADGPVPLISQNDYTQYWGAAAYLFSPHPQRYPQLAENMRTGIRQQALEDNVRFMDERPSRRTSNNNYWQTPHNLQILMLAHALEQDPTTRERMLKAMILEADWGLGRNPSNMVEMTGLGSRRVENAYTSGRNDGSPGMHPGHTPYHNLDPWGFTHNGSNPGWFQEKGYPAWDQGWPHQEGHFNSRYSWTNAEFTPRQTMRGKMALYTYLHSLNQ